MPPEYILTDEEKDYLARLMVAMDVSELDPFQEVRIVEMYRANKGKPFRIGRTFKEF